jgi:inactivated superfamily I helicase
MANIELPKNLSNAELLIEMGRLIRAIENNEAQRALVIAHDVIEKLENQQRAMYQWKDVMFSVANGII